MREFLRRRAHFALVVDEYGALQGLITLEDIIEEIVGDIADEHDVETPVGIEPQPDGSVEVEGAVTIRDLNRACDWSLPDEEANTIAGLVIHEAQAIPSEGQVFSFHGFRFEVLGRESNRLTRLRVRASPEPSRNGRSRPARRQPRREDELRGSRGPRILWRQKTLKRRRTRMNQADTVGRISGTSTASSIRPSGSIQTPSTGRKEKTPPKRNNAAIGSRTSRIPSFSSRSVTGLDAGTARKAPRTGGAAALIPCPRPVVRSSVS